jgi:hypothetical protein
MGASCFRAQGVHKIGKTADHYGFLVGYSGSVGQCAHFLI